MNPLRRRGLQVGLGVLVGAALAGCGFRPRGDIKPVFTQVFTDLSAHNGVGLPLRQALQAAGVDMRPLGAPSDATAALPVLKVEIDQREKSVIAKTVDGQVRELQLRVRFIASVRDGLGHVWMPRTEWVLTQNLGYNETLAYGKELEESLMLPKMEQDIAEQVMRKLAVLRPPSP